jgi:alkanesulfonate monooxygenase SsuD/methylene tetrahydromethanopterin reductase-like flavin-dependent oxidoreductase (luciferase family)
MDEAMNLGVKVDGVPAEQLFDLVPMSEEIGLDELWVVEDLGLAGGIAQAATALALSQRIQVGLGIMPAAVRNVMYMAMEVAALERMHPGRFLAGVGHGMPNWLTQVGARPKSLITALDEVTVALQRLLTGEEVSFKGGHVDLDRVTLRHPPTVPPHLSLGVRGPKGRELARRIAGGTILAEGSGPEYVAKVREESGHDGHRITVFSWFFVDQDGDAALDRMRPTVEKCLSEPFMAAQLGPLANGKADDRTVGELAVAGTGTDCTRSIKRLFEAGADSVVLQPIIGQEAEQLALLSSEIMPLLGKSAA